MATGATGLTDLTLAGMASGLRARAFSAAELAEAHIAAVEAARPLNAFIVETPDHARAAAAAADAALAAASAGPLAGIPLGIKDLFATEGVQTTAGSKILEGFVPQYESTVTAKLFAAGAGMLGKLNMDQFAMGSSNETSAFGEVVSPWRASGSNRVLVPGGSSGGSAAAVAARLCAGRDGDRHRRLDPPAGGVHRHRRDQADLWPLLALGGGGVRLVARPGGADGARRPRLRDPARRDGGVRSEGRDLARCPRARLGGRADRRPARRARRRAEANIASTGSTPRSTRCGTRGSRGCSDAGATVVDVSLPHTKYALPAYYIVAPAEASSNLARYDGVRYGLRVDGGGSARRDVRGDARGGVRARGQAADHDRHLRPVGRVLRRLLPPGAEGADADRARFRAGVGDLRRAADADRAVGGVRPGDKADPLAMYLNDVFTVPSSLAGLPAMSVPAALTATGLPLGLQVIGRPLDEAGVLNAGFALERAAGFTAQPGRWW